MMNRLTIQLLTVIAALISSVSVSAVELLNLTTTEQGMHRVTYEELLAQGADLAGLKVNRFAVTVNGDAVQRATKGQSDGKRGVFGPGAYIEFYAEKADSLYSIEQVYTLHYIGKRERHLRAGFGRVKTRVDLTAGPLIASQYTHTQTIEQNNTYDFAAPSATDPFHFGQTFSFFATPSYPFTLENVVGGSTTADVEVEMYGLLDFDIEGNDHDYEIVVNGELAGSQQFDGATATTLALENVVVNSGENTFKYNYRSIAGVPFDRITLNKFKVSYARTTEASEDYLEGYFDSEQARVTGIVSGKGRVYQKGSNGRIVRVNGVKRLIIL